MEQDPLNDSQNLSTEDRDDGSGTKHAGYVSELALTLFDHTLTLHELNAGCRSILAKAPFLLDHHLPSGKKKTLKAARQLVKDNVSDEYTDVQQEVLVALIALGNGNVKRNMIADMGLDPVQQREVLTLLAILRVAIGLDESNSQSTYIPQIEVSKARIWIVVDGPEAALDAATAQHNANLWEKAGYPKVKVLEASEAKQEILPYPEPIESPGVLPEDTIAEAGRKIMRYHFARMLAHEAGTRLGEDIEDLHKMRVATRRMRAAFVVLESAYEQRIVKAYMKGLRNTGRVLGRVRDLDVMITKARIYQRELPENQQSEMEPLIEEWLSTRETLRQEMLVYLDSDAYQTFKRKYNIFLSTPNAGAHPVPKDAPHPSRVMELTPVMIYDRMAAVRAYDPWLVDASIELLHALRIEIKYLRYTVEFFREVLGPDVDAVIDMMKTMQDHLGDLNDTQIAAKIVGQLLDEWDLDQETLPISERRSPEVIVSYMASRHADLHNLTLTFHEVWNQFNQPELRQILARSVAIL